MVFVGFGVAYDRISHKCKKFLELYNKFGCVGLSSMPLWTIIITGYTQLWTILHHINLIANGGLSINDDSVIRKNMQNCY